MIIFSHNFVLFCHLCNYKWFCEKRNNLQLQGTKHVKKKAEYIPYSRLWNFMFNVCLPLPVYKGLCLREYSCCLCLREYSCYLRLKRVQLLFVFKRVHLLFVFKRVQLLFVSKRVHLLFVFKRAHLLFVFKRVQLLFVFKRVQLLFVFKRVQLLFEVFKVGNSAKQKKRCTAEEIF